MDTKPFAWFSVTNFFRYVVNCLIAIDTIILLSYFVNTLLLDYLLASSYLLNNIVI